jgi:signal transduction histidine kinase
MNGDPARVRFLTAISHDMRQPLHALLLYLGALDRRVHDEDARAVLNKADRAAQSLADMFESLISLARLEANKIEPDVVNVSLKALFDELIAKTPAARADVTQLHVSSDPALLEIILQNLISNAIKHGGGEAHLSAREQDGAVEIAVRDAGPGIAAEDQERIFAEFTRLDNAPADGLGLGLTIAKGLATLLGHAIEVRSGPGAGATFIVRAPRA